MRERSLYLGLKIPDEAASLCLKLTSVKPQIFNLIYTP